MNIHSKQLIQYKFIELAVHLPGRKMIRDRFIRIDDQKAILDWRNQYKNTDIYSTIQQYEKSDPHSRFIAPIFFDIDSQSNQEKARESALILCELIIKRLQIDIDQIDIFFSGNKGFHITVPCNVFQAFPSDCLLELYKKMAQNAQQQGVKYLDTNVYSQRRLWRFSNSINSKSGLYKIPLYHKELLHMRIDKIKDLAREPRPEDNFASARPVKSACQWYRYALKCMARIKSDSVGDRTFTGFKKGWRIPPCIKAMQKNILQDGTRHNAYLVLARFYSWINMHPQQIKEKLLQLDKRHPISDPDSIDRIIKWAAEHPGFAGCDNELLQKYCSKHKCFYYQEIGIKRE